MAKMTSSLFSKDSQILFLELLLCWLIPSPTNTASFWNFPNFLPLYNILIPMDLNSTSFFMAPTEVRLRGKTNNYNIIHDFKTVVPMLLQNLALVYLSGVIFSTETSRFNFTELSIYPEYITLFCDTVLFNSTFLLYFPSRCFNVFSSLVFAMFFPWVSILPLLLGVRINCERLYEG